MDRSIAFYLLTSVAYQDELKQWHKTTRKREVYGQLSSVSASEFFAGGQNGRYLGKNDTIELYCEKRTGDENRRPQQSIQ